MLWRSNVRKIFERLTRASPTCGFALGLPFLISGGSVLASCTLAFAETPNSLALPGARPSADELWQSIENVLSSPEQNIRLKYIQIHLDAKLSLDPTNSNKDAKFYSGRSYSVGELGITFTEGIGGVRVFSIGWASNIEKRVMFGSRAYPPSDLCISSETIKRDLIGFGWTETTPMAIQPHPEPNSPPPSYSFNKGSANTVIYFTGDAACFTGLVVSLDR